MAAPNLPLSSPEADVASLRGLYAREDVRDLDSCKALKVSLPLRLHIRLQALRIHQGAGISETVQQALEEYFERLGRERQDEPGA